MSSIWKGHHFILNNTFIFVVLIVSLIEICMEKALNKFNKCWYYKLQFQLTLETSQVVRKLYDFFKCNISGHLYRMSV